MASLLPKVLHAVVGMCIALASLAGVEAAPKCVWVESLSWCTATVDGPEGEKFVATNAAAAACTANIDERAAGGCAIETSVCKRVTFPDVPHSATCLPVGYTFTSYRALGRSLVAFEDCNGLSSPECNTVRQDMYTGMGCSTCAGTYAQAMVMMPQCFAATDAATCANGGQAPSTAGGDSSFAPGSGMFGGFNFQGEELQESQFDNVQQVAGVQTSDSAPYAKLPAMLALPTLLLCLAPLAFA